MASNSRKQLEGWLKTIDVNGNVLDIGGSQNPIKGRTKSWEVSEYNILDLKEPHEEKKEADLTCDIQDVYPNTVFIATGIAEKIDNIFCIEVSEYWHDPMQAMKNINTLLKKGGILYISFHTLYGLHNPKGEDCLRFTKNAIIKLLEATGFKIEELKARTLKPESRSLYYQFCRSEGMRLDYQDSETYNSGYLVKAKKI